MDRLLTCEEIKHFDNLAEESANDLQYSTEGHFKEEDIQAIYEGAELAKLVAQDAKTLKAVGEWLETWFLSDECTLTTGYLIGKEIIEDLKRGEMPE